MNRRNFLASLVALPAGLRAAAVAYSAPVLGAHQLWTIDFSDIDVVTDRRTAAAVGECWERYLRDSYGVTRHD